MDDPSRMALDIIELRAYARAKDALDNAKRPEDVPSNSSVDKVFEIQAELMRRKRGENR